MKKFITAVVAFALALTVAAPVAASAQTTASYTFNTNLTVGSRGADVVALQTFLEAKGLITIPTGTAKGYFGVLTKNAVAAYQTMKGITPNAGYFGPITRAAVMADGSATTPTTPGCPAGALYNTINGTPCSTGTSTVPGCAAGAVFSSTTGQRCDSTVSPVSPTGEGTLDVKRAATPAGNANVQTQNDVPVLGIEFRARLGDVAVQTLDLEARVTSGVNVENPGTLINTIKIWDGSTVLATYPVNLSTFTKDSNQNYYVRIPGLNFLVPKDATKVLTVSFSTNSIDNDRTVTVGLYGSNAIRAVSGNGVNTFYGESTVGDLTHTFKKPGQSTLTVGGPSVPVRSMNYQIDSISGAQNVKLADFTVESKTADSRVVSVYASTTASGTLPSTLFLYDGSTLIASAPAAANVVFDDLEVVVTKDSIKTLTVRADFPSNAVTGTYASTTIAYVAYEQPTGSTATANGPIASANQYVFTRAPQFAMVGTPTITTVTDTNGKTVSATAKFVFNVTARGGTMIKPVASDFVVNFNGATTGVTKFVQTGTNGDIQNNSTDTVELTASAATTSAAVSGLYTFTIGSITWKFVGDSASTTQTWGLEDFKSPAAQFPGTFEVPFGLIHEGVYAWGEAVKRRSTPRSLVT
jgi:peptidoglycan hydrolase-like protein with peptidoglycan-binding domain